MDGGLAQIHLGFSPKSSLEGNRNLQVYKRIEDKDGSPGRTLAGIWISFNNQYERRLKEDF